MKLQLTYHFDDETELRAHLATDTRAPVEPVAAPVEPVAAPVEERTEVGSETDADGLPYDADVHSDPPAFTSDGLWRAKRGKADEAKKVRADFKAAGGDIEPPVMPAAPAAIVPSMPGMPSAAGVQLPADAPEPVTMEKVIEKITGMMTRGVLDEATLKGMYQKHSGVVDPTASYGVFNTNESARANLFNDLCETEPEMA
jgi:hypothetical protein